MTDIILVRHGETDWNREWRFQGHSDTPLNARGHEQASRLVRVLQSQGVSRIVSSDLSRTQQTAAPLAAHLGLKPELDAAWREQAFGDMEGILVAQMPLLYPKHWAQYQLHDPDYRLPGGAESRRQFQARAVAALRRLAAQHAIQRQAGLPAAAGAVVVFTHGGLLDMLHRSAQGSDLRGPRRVPTPNTGINRLRVGPNRIEVLSWADAGHLQGLPMLPDRLLGESSVVVQAQQGLADSGSEFR